MVFDMLHQSQCSDAVGCVMDGTSGGRLDREGVAALAHMDDALGLLDRCDDAADVGAHLDLAICRLRALLERNGITVAPRPSEMPPPSGQPS